MVEIMRRATREYAVLEDARRFATAMVSRRRDTKNVARFQEWQKKITSKHPQNDGLDILILLSQKPGETGSGVSTREMMQELLRQGHNVHLMACDYRPISGRDLGIEDERIHTICFTPPSPVAADIRTDVGFPIPGMSVKMPYANIPYRAMTESQLREYFEVFYQKIRELVDNLNPDIIHINHLWFLPAIAQLAAPWLPMIGTARGTDLLLLSDKPSFGRLVIGPARSLDIVTAISPDVRQRTIKAYGIPEDRVRVIPNGYDERVFFVDQRMIDSKERDLLFKKYGINISTGAKLVLAIAKYVHWKGLQYLIRATAEFYQKGSAPVITLILGSGDQDMAEMFKQQIETLGLGDSVILAGKVAHSDIAKFMNVADLLVVPSVYEAFGRVLLEGLATGTRAVATAVGGLPSIVKSDIIDRGLVLLVRPIKANSKWQARPSDEEPFSIELGQDICKMIQKEATLDDRLRIAASVSNDNWHTRVAQILNVYREAINSRLHARLI